MRCGCSSRVYWPRPAWGGSSSSRCVARSAATESSRPWVGPGRRPPPLGFGPRLGYRAASGRGGSGQLCHSLWEGPLGAPAVTSGARARRPLQSPTALRVASPLPPGERCEAARVARVAAHHGLQAARTRGQRGAQPAALMLRMVHICTVCDPFAIYIRLAFSPGGARGSPSRSFWTLE